MTDSIRGNSRDATYLLRLALGVVYLHFGALKFYPDLSPAELIGGETLARVSGHLLDARAAIWWLAVIECAIGIGFLFNLWMRAVVVLFLMHMVGTFLPLVVLPELTFKFAPFAPNLEGQYILKNIVFFAAGWTVLVPHIRRKRPQPDALAAGESQGTGGPQRPGGPQRTDGGLGSEEVHGTQGGRGPGGTRAEGARAGEEIERC